MRVIIAGSRRFNTTQDTIEAAKVLLQAIRECGWEITEVVCGEASGMDGLGKRWAESKGIHIESFPADWDKYGDAAGPIRNMAMGQYADALICIHQNTSGSKNMVKVMKRLGKPVLEKIIGPSHCL